MYRKAKDPSYTHCLYAQPHADEIRNVAPASDYTIAKEETIQVGAPLGHILHKSRVQEHEISHHARQRRINAPMTRLIHLSREILNPR